MGTTIITCILVVIIAAAMEGKRRGSDWLPPTTMALVLWLFVGIFSPTRSEETVSLRPFGIVELGNGERHYVVKKDLKTPSFHVEPVRGEYVGLRCVTRRTYIGLPVEIKYSVDVK